jgi:hypothetical protein
LVWWLQEFILFNIPVATFHSHTQWNLRRQQC